MSSRKRYEILAYHKAKAYAAASIYYFRKKDIRLAARYWHRIYGLKYLCSEDLFKTMSLFSDNAVYCITDYIRERTYAAQGI